MEGGRGGGRRKLFFSCSVLVLAFNPVHSLHSSACLTHTLTDVFEKKNKRMSVYTLGKLKLTM